MTYLQGASFPEAHLEGTILVGAHLQAILVGTHLQAVGTSDPSMTFAERIRERIGEESDLSGVIFEGGLSREVVDSIVEGLPYGAAEILRNTLKSHINVPASHEPPEDSGAVTGTYTKEEAEQWIAEYEEAMSGIPKSGDN